MNYTHRGQVIPPGAAPTQRAPAVARAELRSEAAAHGDEGAVIAPACPTETLEPVTHPGLISLLRDAERSGAVAFVEGQARYPQAAGGDRLRLRVDLLARVLELAVPRQLGVRDQVLVDFVAGLPTRAADQRIDLLLGNASEVDSVGSLSA